MKIRELNEYDAIKISDEVEINGERLFKIRNGEKYSLWCTLSSKVYEIIISADDIFCFGGNEYDSLEDVPS